MSLAAGDYVRGRLVAHDMDQITLSDTTPDETGTWLPYGSEQLVFANPGVPVSVECRLTAYAAGVGGTNVNANVRLALSLDGGASWMLSHTTASAGGGAFGDVDGGAHRLNLSAVIGHAGSATGEHIIAKAEVRSTSMILNYFQGRITASMWPVTA
jgi:hypothetical protein